MKTQQKNTSIIIMIDGDFYEVPIEFVHFWDKYGQPIPPETIMEMDDILLEETDLELKVEIGISKEELKKYKIEEETKTLN